MLNRGRKFSIIFTVYELRAGRAAQKRKRKKYIILHKRYQSLRLFNKNSFCTKISSRIQRMLHTASHKYLPYSNNQIHQHYQTKQEIVLYFINSTFDHVSQTALRVVSLYRYYIIRFYFNKKIEIIFSRNYCYYRLLSSFFLPSSVYRHAFYWH